jgi:hypothetical protein
VSKQGAANDAKAPLSALLLLPLLSSRKQAGMANNHCCRRACKQRTSDDANFPGVGIGHKWNFHTK